jgi:hypothetical protein
VDDWVARGDNNDHWRGPVTYHATAGWWPIALDYFTPTGTAFLGLLSSPGSDGGIVVTR